MEQHQSQKHQGKQRQLMHAWHLLQLGWGCPGARDGPPSMGVMMMMSSMLLMAWMMRRVKGPAPIAGQPSIAQSAAGGVMAMTLTQVHASTQSHTACFAMRNPQDFGRVASIRMWRPLDICGSCRAKHEGSLHSLLLTFHLVLCYRRPAPVCHKLLGLVCNCLHHADANAVTLIFQH